MSQETHKPKKRGPGRPFVKGDPRISPGGLPKEVREFHQHYREALVAALAKPSHSDETKSRFQAGLEKVSQAFEKGNQWAVAEVLDRLIGKPKQSVEASGADGNPLETLVKIVHIGAAD
jgi:hypothetical protein